MRWRMNDENKSEFKGDYHRIMREKKIKWKSE